jgi:ATP-dependent protease ClpP protease subunit
MLEVTQFTKSVRVRITGRLGFDNDEYDLAEMVEQIGNCEDVRLEIDSTGGCCWTAKKIFHALARRTTVATITGACISSAVLVALVSPKIRMYSTARMMIHGSFAWVFANASDFRKQAESIEESDRELKALLSNRVKNPEKVNTWLSGEDHWFDAKEALAEGLIDEVIKRPARKQATHTSGKPAKQDAQPESSEKFFFDLLRALGPISTEDRKKFHANLGQWLSINLK